MQASYNNNSIIHCSPIFLPALALLGTADFNSLRMVAMMILFLESRYSNFDTLLGTSCWPLFWTCRYSEWIRLKYNSAPMAVHYDTIQSFQFASFGSHSVYSLPWDKCKWETFFAGWQRGQRAFRVGFGLSLYQFQLITHGFGLYLWTVSTSHWNSTSIPIRVY